MILFRLSIITFLNVDFWKKFFFTWLIILSLTSCSSHVPVVIFLECIGNNQYVITLTLFEDCGTAFIQNVAENITVTNTCSIFFQSNNQCLSSITEKSQLSPQMISQSECNGGSLPGFMTPVEILLHYCKL